MQLDRDDLTAGASCRFLGLILCCVPSVLKAAALQPAHLSSLVDLQCCGGCHSHLTCLDRAANEVFRRCEALYGSSDSVRCGLK